MAVIQIVVDALHRFEARLCDFVDPRPRLLRELREELVFCKTMDAEFKRIREVIDRVMDSLRGTRIPKDLVANRHDKGYSKQ